MFNGPYLWDCVAMLKLHRHAVYYPMRHEIGQSRVIACGTMQHDLASVAREFVAVDKSNWDGERRMHEVDRSVGLVANWCSTN